MELQLVRVFLKENITLGELHIENKFFCYTVEDKVRSPFGQAWNKLFKIYAKTAIPYGRYPVMVTWSNRFQRLLTAIFNVPDFEGIRIHNGVSELSSAGCIIVSYKRNVDGTLFNSKDAMNDLCNMIKLRQDTEKIYITISNSLTVH